MSHWITAVLVLAFLVLPGLLAALGHTPDTRDPNWSVGHMLNVGRTKTH